ncbi:hypothetical protein [Paenarthrobacter ureafaciens]|nr:hypothetical protein [Paenarthrobacter ureafaciens]MCX8454557.1 hypothetical protein [Paenarthrobacter ureafaciens]MCY0974306.1 hypothetical protein [Paenarthrobacter ureafaciens]
MSTRMPRTTTHIGWHGRYCCSSRTATFRHRMGRWSHQRLRRF